VGCWPLAQQALSRFWAGELSSGMVKTVNASNSEKRNTAIQFD